MSLPGFPGYALCTWRRAKSKQYYKNCYIEGTTDFIFGAATALFENCSIYCKKGAVILLQPTRLKKLLTEWFF
nr:pectinesterase family protein [Niabella hibiscisoli]